MIPDLVFAAIAGMATRNFLVFLILCLLAVVFNRTDRPLSGNVIKFAAVAAFSLIEFVVLLVGISALFSLFGGYGDKHDT